MHSGYLHNVTAAMLCFLCCVLRLPPTSPIVVVVQPTLVGA